MNMSIIILDQRFSLKVILFTVVAPWLDFIAALT